MTQTPDPHSIPADSETSWLLSRLSPRAQAYAQLARYDRPIGAWLLFWPCFWGLFLAGAINNVWPPFNNIVAFAIGALAMRGAGCTYNDIIDRKLDAQVARTALRPLPSGRVSLSGAWGFFLAQLFIGLLVLLSFQSLFMFALGLAALGLVAAYPFMKRFTYWPQAWLGLTFNWGALMGYAVISDNVPPQAMLLYAAGFFWTLGYDTVYAHQDKEDDALIGIKSTALSSARAPSRCWPCFMRWHWPVWRARRLSAKSVFCFGRRCRLSLGIC